MNDKHLMMDHMEYDNIILLYPPEKVSSMLNSIDDTADIKPLHFINIRHYHDGTFTDKNNLKKYLTFKVGNEVISNIIVDNLLKYSVNISFRTFESNNNFFNMNCYLKGNVISFQKSSNELINILTDYAVFNVNKKDLITAYEFNDILGVDN